MEKEKEPPFPRQPWQRLLQDRADAPPETTDARIRAAARRRVQPSAARWWLPASLAASFLLAVLIVQSQYGKDEKSAVVSESDVDVPATSLPAQDNDSAGIANERAASPATSARKEATSPESLDETAPEAYVPEPPARVGGPEQELKAASEMDAADEPAPSPGTGIAPPAAVAPPATAIFDSARMDATGESAAGATETQAAEKLRTPEAWYADIEALRQAGRNTEADAELARFEAAFPGWIKQHGRTRP